MTCINLYGKIKNGIRSQAGYWNFTNKEIGVMKDTHLIEYVQDYGGISSVPVLGGGLEKIATLTM